jgi:hypothetical protein
MKLEKSQGKSKYGISILNFKDGKIAAELNQTDGQNR